MARFDDVFAELQAKLTAAMSVIAQDPALAQQVRDAIDGATAEAEAAEGVAQDESRANALHSMIIGAREILAEAATDTP